MLLTLSQYELINGYSNYYWGWGQEDDDLYYRLAARFGSVVRLDAASGRYKALTHPRVRDLDVTPLFTRGTKHLTLTRLGQLDTRSDGISSLRAQWRAVERWNKWPRGVRKIVAQLQFEFMPKDLNGNTD